MSWLLLEPYYDGSHRRLVDGIVEHTGLDAHLWTLPARKWKWRMRGSALDFARRIHDAPFRPDGIFASSMTNVAELVALLPPVARGVPVITYFHENQLTYPVQEFDPRDHHFAWTNALAALSADTVLWNSAYNRDSFLDRLAWLVRKMPDARPDWIVDAIAERSHVLPVPIDDARIEADARESDPRRGPCHVVWNHRWEHDKGPERLEDCVHRLIERGLDFRLSVVGQGFRTVPEPFGRLHEVLGKRRGLWGFVVDRADYHRLLGSADVVLSTARHEFQGLAVLEGAAAGAVPLVPDDLAYPEIWPREWRYGDPVELAERLAERIRDVETWRRVDPRPIARRHGWSCLRGSWARVFDTARHP